jgi:hypothetical protein
MTIRLSEFIDLKAVRPKLLLALVVMAVTLVQVHPGNTQIFNDPRFNTNFTGNVTVTVVNTSQTPTTSSQVFTSPASLVALLISTYKSPKTQTALQGDIVTAINSALNSAGGLGLYMSPPNGPVINLDQTPVVSGFSDPGTQQVGLMMTFKNNSITANITTPGPAPTSTNPKATLTFSAQAAVLLSLQNNKPSIVQAAAQTFNANLNPGNFTGDILKALSNLGILKLPNFNQSADIPTAALNQLNADLTAGAAAAKVPGDLTLVSPTTAIALKLTSGACPTAGLQSVASPCGCLPGANLNYPQGCDPYGTAMCLSAAQLAKVPKCANTQYLVCGNLPAIATRDRSGGWFNKLSLRCVKVPIASTSPNKSGVPPKGSGLPVSNSQNTNANQKHP